MRLSIGILLLITLSASPLQKNTPGDFLIVWNVGQGQWVTVLEKDHCLHFDAGGEFFPWKRLAFLCGKRPNHLFLSHWDWDHIGAIAKWPHWPVCLELEPIGKTSSHKSEMLKGFERCADDDRNTEIVKWTPPPSKDSNSESHVVKFKKFLIPGDSPKTQEKSWAKVPWIKQTKILILGHHGSRTSTSEELLDEMPHLQLAVASARWSRYHHPHPETEALLRKHSIPILRTEDWGNLWFEL